MSGIDTSQFDHITDRVARAKAKAEAMRKAKAGAAPEAGEPPEATLAANPAAAEAALPEPSPEPDLEVPFVEFESGSRFRWNGREGEISATRYDLVHLTYDNGAEHTVVIDRFRLSAAMRQGDFELITDLEAYRPQRTGRTERVDHHEFVWLETRKGMTAKKKRPRSIAIVNPDGCTGCNSCIEVCPTDCIEEVDVADAGLSGIGHYCEIRLEGCIGCVQCVNMCPWDAIDMVKTDEVEKAYEIPVGTL